MGGEEESPNSIGHPHHIGQKDFGQTRSKKEFKSNFSKGKQKKMLGVKRNANGTYLGKDNEDKV